MIPLMLVKSKHFADSARCLTSTVCQLLHMNQIINKVLFLLLLIEIITMVAQGILKQSPCESEKSHKKQNNVGVTA